MREATLPIADLARAVHAQWREDRQAAGWRVGPYDRAARTSPYLKAYDDFTAPEALREHWLTLGDMLTLAKVTGAHRRQFHFDAPLLRAGVTALSAAPDDAPLILDAAALVHRTWRFTNAHLEDCVGDARATTRFEDLSAEDRATTIANLRADMRAVGAFFAARDALRACRIALTPRMAADRRLLERFLGEAARNVT